jgi:hypothetical protein
MNTSNWPNGVDYSGQNFTGRTPRVSRCVGGYAPDSEKIPLVESCLWVGGTVFAVWATVKIAFWIWG